MRTWGFTTDSAGDGEEALQRITVFRPSIIISDLVMPHMGGLDLLRALQGDGGDFTVVILTAQGTVETAVEAIKAGAYDYLTKPIEPQRLKSCSTKLSSGRTRFAKSSCSASSSRPWHLRAHDRQQSSHAEGLYQTVEQASPTSASVLIWGESGDRQESSRKRFTSCRRVRRCRSSRSTAPQFRRRFSRRDLRP